MCGIVGLLKRDSLVVDRDCIKLMSDTLSHRGPDGEGIFCEGPIGLGHKRLSIFDLTKAGAQPMISSDGRYIIVHNGEVYNWPEIRQELKFNSWKSKTDTETILYAYIEKGVNCLSLFNGMFGFAIWDKQEELLFLARDRVGIKPLFFGFHDKNFYFASEIKAFFANGFPKAANFSAIYDFLRWGAIDHSPDAFFTNIKSVKPGHYLLLKKGEALKEICYWDLIDLVNNGPIADLPGIIDEYSVLLEDAINLRLRSDVKVGVFLSGGVDSSILGSSLAKSCSQERLQSFTYEFDTGSAGEGEYAKEVADWLGLKNYVVLLNNKDIPDYFSKALYNQEMPITSIRCLSSQKLYEKVKEMGTTVILEGHGGDHLGAGFEYYFVPYVMDIAKRDGAEYAFKLLNNFMKLYKIPNNNYYRTLFNCFSAYQQPGTSTQDGISFIKLNCLSRDLINSYNTDRVNFPRPFRENLLNAQYIDFRYHNLPRVLRYTDRESMASGCEARVPLLDHRLVELCFRASINAKVNGADQRYFMRQAADRFLPKELLYRPKRSIVDPQRSWLQNELKGWIADIFNSDSFGKRGAFNQDEVIKEYKQYCSEERPITGFHIFQYLNVELWFRNMIDQ